MNLLHLTLEKEIKNMEYKEYKDEYWYAEENRINSLNIVKNTIQSRLNQSNLDMKFFKKNKGRYYTEIMKHDPINFFDNCRFYRFTQDGESQYQLNMDCNRSLTIKDNQLYAEGGFVNKKFLIDVLNVVIDLFNDVNKLKDFVDGFSTHAFKKCNIFTSGDYIRLGNIEIHGITEEKYNLLKNYLHKLIEYTKLQEKFPEKGDNVKKGKI